MKTALAELFLVPFYYPGCQKSLSTVSAFFFLDYFLKLKSSFASGLPQEFSGMLENQIERGRQEKRKPMCKITTDITY